MLLARNPDSSQLIGPNLSPRCLLPDPAAVTTAIKVCLIGQASVSACERMCVCIHVCGQAHWSQVATCLARREAIFFYRCLTTGSKHSHVMHTAPGLIRRQRLGNRSLGRRYREWDIWPASFENLAKAHMQILPKRFEFFPKILIGLRKER